MIEEKNNVYIKIPRLLNGNWDFLEFKSKKEYLDFLKSKLNKIGNYNLKNTNLFRSSALKFINTGKYTDKVAKSKEWIDYWDFEKIKSWYGVIIDDYFLTGHYYFYLNFCPIYQVQKKKLEHPEVWDSHYDYTIRLEISKHTGLHSLVLKKRRWGFSLITVADMYRMFIFKNKSILKFIHKDEDPSNKNYRIFIDYKSFIDKETAWYRPVQGDSKGLFQRIESTDLDTKKKRFKGTQSLLEIVCTAKNPASGVGGYLDIGFYDEAGTNNMLITSMQYNEKSMKFGGKTTGFFTIGGSVGELKQSEDLKNLMYNPKNYGCYSVFNEDLNQQTGLFYPEYCNYLGSVKNEEGEQIDEIKFYDEDGNSFVEEAIEYILKERFLEKGKSPEAYRLSISQAPLTIEECFSERLENKFPTHIIQPRYDKLYQFKDKIGTYCNIEKNGNIYKPKFVNSTKKVLDLPIKKDSDIEGCCVIYEYPIQNAPVGLYYAGIDPVTKKEANRSTTTSLMSCYIIKAENMINGEYSKKEIVAEYVGRYNNYEKTYREVTNLCYFYNARMLVENNVGDYITWCLSVKSEYKGINYKLIQGHELTNLKDIVTHFTASQNYGIFINTKLKDYLFDMIIAYIENPINKLFNETTGEETIIKGIDRFPCHMALLEMLKFTPKLNVDRLVSLGLCLWAEEILCSKNNFIIKNKFENTNTKNYIPKDRNQFNFNFRFNNNSYFR